MATSTAASLRVDPQIVVEVAGEEIERGGRVERGAEASGEERGAGHGVGAQWEEAAVAPHAGRVMGLGQSDLGELII